MVQKIINLNNDSSINNMTKINRFLFINIKIKFKCNQYWIITTNLQSNLQLIR